MVEITWPWQYNFPPFFTYINEGNLHIVLQLVGTDSVIRLIKEDKTPTCLKSVQNSIHFVNMVMSPLLCAKEQYRHELIKLQANELADLIEKLNEFRPEDRKFKSSINIYAIKAHNLTILSPNLATNYCVEIKAKEGFVTAKFKKYSKCYYCLKQFLKLQTQQIEKFSSYCPVDLFSGDKIRMKRALAGLSSNPQNNFKVFQNGTILYNEKSAPNVFNDVVKDMGIFGDSIGLFYDFIIEVLLSNASDTNIVLKETVYWTVAKSEYCTEGNSLDHNTILHRLLSLQNMPDNLIYDIVDHSDESLDYVITIINQLKLENLNLNLQSDREKFYSTTNSTNLALISAVAKDCSIMISFSSNFEENLPTIQVGELKVPFKVAVTDLEPKSLKSLKKRKKTENQLAEIYEQCLNSSVSNIGGKIQPHTETRAKQLEAWQHLIADYMKTNKQSTLDIRESQNSPLFHNASINRKLSQESILIVLENMAKSGQATPLDKSKNVWEIYWHSLDEWGNMVYTWACNNGLNNSVCTLFELREGENTVDEEFHGLDMNVLVKALRTLEGKGRCELIEFDDHQGVKFF